MRKLKALIPAALVVAAVVMTSCAAPNSEKSDGEGKPAENLSNAAIFDIKNQLGVLYAPPSENAFEGAKTALGAYMNESTLNRFCGGYTSADGVTCEVKRVEYGYANQQDDACGKLYAEIETRYDGRIFTANIIFLLGADGVISDYILF
jgi:hypothetical protein